MDAACINYKDTGFFSQTVTDYIEDAPALREFYGYRPDFDGFAEFLKNKKVVADRKILVDALNQQYTQIAVHSPAVDNNISLLSSDNTYTVTTGHQLNIFAGPLYFIYKIVTAIKLSQQLKEKFPGKIFVPGLLDGIGRS